MRQHRLIGICLFLLIAGCTSSKPKELPSLISGNAFVKRWQADLGLGSDSITELYAREKMVIAYTASNHAIWLSASGGQPMASHQIVNGQRSVFPPIVLADHVVIPTATSIEVFNKNGLHEDSYITPSAVQGPGVGSGNSVYVPVAQASSGRLAKYTVGKNLSLAWEMFTSRGIAAAPALMNDAVFVGGIDGKLIAITGNRDPLWNLPSNAFQTDGKITGDVAVDEDGVYVASQDKKLYCLDRGTGKIRWIYYAPFPLLKGPVVSGNSVYQLVPNVGMVAINKTEGPASRAAMWTQPSAEQVVGADDKYVYVRVGGGTIGALDRASGEIIFHTSRNDLTAFATNGKTATIYAATRRGSVLAIDPVLKPGTIGEMVFNEHLIRPMMASSR